jgi:lipopolysaccharide transport system ATP-binding protein
MSSEVAIRVEGVSKCYLVYDRPQDRLYQAIVPRLKRLAGRTVDAAATRYFREFWALQDISFEVPRGSTLGIIGRNGSGKSTLLQIVCGTLTPTTGEVEVNGRVAALLELGSGFNPEFTGRENIYLNASILGLTRQQTDERFDAIAAFADIGDFIEQPVKTYSSGMVVRLAFAVIAHVDADILVIDEALSVGDAFFSQKCMRFLRRFMENGTVLFVSHDTGAVLSLCDTAIWIDRGRNRLQGSARHVSDQYLEALVEERQGPGSAAVAGARASTARSPSGESAPQGAQETGEEVIDLRWDLLRQSSYRNDIEIFEFDPGAASFGKGHGRIVGVELTSPEGSTLAYVTGGEAVVLTVRAEALEELISPIVGFFLRDRLGQALFGDNTFLSTHSSPLHVAAGRHIVARFAFRMPILPMGDYSITVALAEGTQQDHVQHHWIHDALVFRSHSSSVRHGLIGLPMRSVTMDIDPSQS